MGGKIVDDHRPAFPAVGGAVEPAVRRDNDHFLARSDSMHSGVRLGKGPPDALPARVGIAPEHSVASRGPQSCRMVRVLTDGIDIGGGNPCSPDRPVSSAIATRPAPAPD